MTHISNSDNPYPHIRFNFEKPLAEFARRFYEPGKPRYHHPHSVITQPFAEFATPSHATFRSPVPVVYMRCGSCTFGIANWLSESGSQEAMYRQAERRVLGFPLLIPASSVDLIPGGETSSASQINIRAHNGGDLFVAATFSPGPTGEPRFVTPIIAPAGDRLRDLSIWQPLLIDVTRIPTDQNFEFIKRADQGRLQALTDAVDIEVISENLRSVSLGSS